jgi:hypothetical protein
VIVGLLGSGCTYTQNRATDFVDAFGWGAGVGLGGNIRATHYLQTTGALPMLTGPRVRIQGRLVEAPVGPSLEWGLAPIVYFRGNTFTFPAGKEESRTIILGRTLLDAKKDRYWQQWYDSRAWSFFPDIKAYEQNYDRRLFDLGFSLYLGLGIDFDFNPYEFADFVVGFFGLDLAGDDESDQVERAPSSV